MLKRDRIFWWAAGIFVLAIIIFAITGEQLWLALMIASYLLRPTLASLGIAKRSVDERQMSIQYRSGNIAFAVMMVTAVILAALQSAKGDPNWDLFNIIIIVGLAAKALSNVLLVKNYRLAASKIIIAVGLLIALFASMSHGLSISTLMEAGPGLAIAGIGWLSRKFPRIVGVFVFAVTAALEFVILQKGFTIGQLTTATVIGVPLVLAGVSLFIGGRDEGSSEEDDSLLSGGSGHETGGTAANRLSVTRQRVRLLGWIVGILGGLAIVASLAFRFGNNRVKEYEPLAIHEPKTWYTLRQPTEIQGITCDPSGLVRFHGNGKLERCRLLNDTTLAGNRLPSGTMVSFDTSGQLDWCFLAHDTEIDGHLCKGRGDNFMTRALANRLACP